MPDFQIPPAPDEDALRPGQGTAYQPLPEASDRFLMRDPGGYASLDDGTARKSWNARGQTLYSGPSREASPYSGALVPYTDEPKDITLRIDGFQRRAYLPKPLLPAPEGAKTRIPMAMDEYDDGQGLVAGAPPRPFSFGMGQPIDTPLSFRTLPKPDPGQERMDELLRGAPLKDMIDWQDSRMRGAETRAQIGEAQDRGDYYKAQAKNLAELTDATKEERLAQAASRKAYAENYGNRMSEADKIELGAAYSALLDRQQTLDALLKSGDPDQDALQEAKGAIAAAQRNVDAIRQRAGGGAGGGAGSRKDPNWQKLKAAFPDLPDAAIDAKYQRFMSMQ